MPAAAPHNHPQSSLPILAILLGLIVYFGISIGQTSTQINQNQQRLQQLQTEVQELRQRKAALASQLTQRQSPSYIEAEARNLLGLAKDNETTIIFPLSQAVLGASTSAPPHQSTQAAGDIPSTVASWQRFFFR